MDRLDPTAWHSTAWHSTHRLRSVSVPSISNDGDLDGARPAFRGATDGDLEDALI